jgi:AcrR family transcriptional regulator
METRKRLLEEVERRCIATHYRDITVAEIARAADTSAATFYHYFPDVGAAAAEVATAHLRKFDSVLDLAAGVVSNKGDLRSCRELAQAFVSFWDARRGLLDVIEIASADEDPRFFAPLYQAFHALTDTLAEGVRSGHPVAVAGALVMMLSHTTARQDAFAVSKVGRYHLIEALALVLHATLAESAADGDARGS